MYYFFFTLSFSRSLSIHFLSHTLSFSPQTASDADAGRGLRLSSVHRYRANRWAQRWLCLGFYRFWDLYFNIFMSDFLCFSERKSEGITRRVSNMIVGSKRSFSRKLTLPGPSSSLSLSLSSLSFDCPFCSFSSNPSTLLVHSSQFFTFF